MRLQSSESCTGIVPTTMKLFTLWSMARAVSWSSDERSLPVLEIMIVYAPAKGPSRPSIQRISRADGSCPAVTHHHLCGISHFKGCIDSSGMPTYCAASCIRIMHVYQNGQRVPASLPETVSARLGHLTPRHTRRTKPEQLPMPSGCFPWPRLVTFFHSFR